MWNPFNPIYIRFKNTWPYLTFKCQNWADICSTLTFLYLSISFVVFKFRKYWAGNKKKVLFFPLTIVAKCTVNFKLDWIVTPKFFITVAWHFSPDEEEGDNPFEGEQGANTAHTKEKIRISSRRQRDKTSFGWSCPHATPLLHKMHFYHNFTSFFPVNALR